MAVTLDSRRSFLVQEMKKRVATENICTCVQAYPKVSSADLKNYSKEVKIINYIDYTDTLPKELLDQWAAELEPKPTLDNTAFYATDEDGETYFYCGNSRLKVSEHFADTGKPVGDLLEDVIGYLGQ